MTENNVLKPTLIDVSQYNLTLTKGVNKLTYEEDINILKKNTGVTIQNISFPLLENVYKIPLKNIGKTLNCGNIIENFFIELKRNEIENVVLILDFDEVEELNESFYESYTKILLESSNKIISINMNTQLSNEFAAFINSKVIVDVEE